MYKLSRHWATIRYTYISVKDTSDVYQWIEAYITGSKNEEVKKQTTQLDLRLGKESGKGDDTPFWYNDDQDDDDDDSLQFDMATNTGSQTWLNFEDKKGAFQQIRVYRSSNKIGGNSATEAQAREIFTYELIVRNEAIWKIWRWGDSSHAVTVAESFIDLCKVEHKAKTHGKLELHALVERWGGCHWTKVGNVNKRSLDTIHLPLKLKQDIVSDCEQFLQDRELYERIGIPYRRGYLLYGEPGCGKSSFLKALASHLNVPLCKLDLTGGGSGGVKLSDSALEIVINRAPQRSILYVEEIDTLFLSKADKKKEGGGQGRGHRGGQPIPGSDSDSDSDSESDHDGGAVRPREPRASKPPAMSKTQLHATDELLSEAIAQLMKQDSQVKRLESVAKIVSDFAPDNKDMVPSEGIPGAVTKQVSVEAPKRSPEPHTDTPFDTTAEWKQIIDVLETEGRFDLKTNSFVQPAEDLKVLHESVAFNLQVTLQDTQEMQKMFKPIDISQLLLKLQELQNAFKRAGHKPEESKVVAEPAETKHERVPYKSKASFREPAKNTICSFGGLLQALDGVMAQEGRMVFFTTNHIEKLDEALIRPGRMDRKFEFRHAESEAVAEQFIRLFSKAPDTNAQGRRELPALEHVQAQAAKFEQMIKRAEAEVEGFKPPTLAESQARSASFYSVLSPFKLRTH